MLANLQWLLSVLRINLNSLSATHKALYDLALSLLSLLHWLSVSPLASLSAPQTGRAFTALYLWFLLLTMPFPSAHSKPPPLPFAWLAPS